MFEEEKMTEVEKYESYEEHQLDFIHNYETEYIDIDFIDEEDEYFKRLIAQEPSE